MKNQATHSGAADALVAGVALSGLNALIAVDDSSGGSAAGLPLSDELKLRHLLRRAGFGASRVELDAYRRLGLAGTVDQLVNYDQVDNSALDARLTSLALDLSKRADISRWWLNRMISTARPLEEKMTLFWHGLLTSGISKVGRPEPMLTQNQFFRANALGNFSDILKGVSKDSAMMLWLDTATNRKGKPNENYARELMELFSMGVNQYTEQDVKESARAFTGWSLIAHPKLGQFQYRFAAGQHDNGTKTFQGETGNFDGDNIIDIIVKQPVSARYIAGKVFAFFAYPNPTDDVLNPLVQVYQSSQYSIKALVLAILTCDAFYAPAAYRAQIKSPVDYVVGAVRALGIQIGARGLPLVLTELGQELFNPPNVAGWPGGSSWLTSGTWLTRLNLANTLSGGLATGASGAVGGGVDFTPNLQALSAGVASPADYVDALSETLLDGQIQTEQRQVLIDYLTPLDPTNVDPTWLAERRHGALYLTLAMPEYHLA